MGARVLLLLCGLAPVVRAAPTDGGVRLFPTHVPDVGNDAARVAESAEQAAGEARVESGQVPPPWRQVERAAAESFHPPRAAVAVGSAPRALAEQVVSNPPRGPERTRNEPVPEARRGELDLDEQVEATHQAARRPRHWRRVEVEAELGPDGRAQSLRVTLPSEDARLDEAALAAVGDALARHPISGPAGQYRARFRLSAARSVKPLDVAPVTDATPRHRLRGVMPKMRFSFDETSGKMAAEKPFSEEIHTDVKLISLSPVAPR
jgi:hypothetical protein